jgi:hypothetical protein
MAPRSALSADRCRVLAVRMRGRCRFGIEGLTGKEWTNRHCALVVTGSRLEPSGRLPRDRGAREASASTGAVKIDEERAFFCARA